MEQKVSIGDVCRILEIPMGNYGLKKQTKKEEAKKALQDFKDLVKKQWRVLAKKYHPDLPSSGKYELAKMKDTNACIDLIMKLEIIKIPQRPQPQKVSFHFQGVNVNASTSTSNSSAFFNGVRFYKF